MPDDQGRRRSGQKIRAGGGQYRRSGQEEVMTEDQGMSRSEAQSRRSGQEEVRTEDKSRRRSGQKIIRRWSGQKIRAEGVQDRRSGQEKVRKEDQNWKCSGQNIRAGGGQRSEQKINQEEVRTEDQSRRRSGQEISVVDPDPHGSAFKKSSWIRIRMDRCGSRSGSRR